MASQTREFATMEGCRVAEPKLKTGRDADEENREVSDQHWLHSGDMSQTESDPQQQGQTGTPAVDAAAQEFHREQ